MRTDAKPLIWLHGEIKTPSFSAPGRSEAGTLLRRLQLGDHPGMPQSRALPAIGAACHELRLHHSDFSWRIVYFLDHEAIVILDVFAKQSRATPIAVIELSRLRLAAYRRVLDSKAMKSTTTKRLTRAGWRIGTAQDFLGLSTEAAALIEIRICLSGHLRQRRIVSGLSQSAFALKMASSQSRTEKMETADAAVPLDILIRALLALGADAAWIGKALMDWDSHA